MNDEQVYALFVEANPFADLEMLPMEPEDNPVDHPANLQVVSDTPPDLDTGGKPPKGRGRYLTLAAVIIAVIGFGALMLRDLGVSEPAVGTQPAPAIDPIAQVESFFVALDSGNVDAAVALLDSPLASIYFPALDEVTSLDQVVDYFEFYGIMGGRTEVLDCVSERMGPRSIVTCQVDQQVGALIPLGLEFPPFPLIFEVWDSGIRRIGLDSASKPVFDHVFGSSRFFDFNDRHIRPNGLAKDSGGPVWSKENGERILELLRLYLAE